MTTPSHRAREVADKLQSGVDNAREQIKAAVEQSSRRLVEIRHKAADAALQWVLAHDDRVKSFRSSVKGSPIEKALDKLLGLLRAEAKTAKTAKTAKPARKRPAAERARKAAKKKS